MLIVDRQVRFAERGRFSRPTVRGTLFKHQMVRGLTMITQTELSPPCRSSISRCGSWAWLRSLRFRGCGDAKQRSSIRMIDIVISEAVKHLPRLFALCMVAFDVDVVRHVQHKEGRGGLVACDLAYVKRVSGAL